MKQLRETNKIIGKESKLFFELILAPTIIDSIQTLESINKQNSLKKYHQLWKLIQKSNLSCFQLTGIINKSQWEIFYLDLETPIIFVPILEEKILLTTFYNLKSLSKTIKSNLMNYYNQELETIIIQINESKKINEVIFSFYKVMEQDSFQLKNSHNDNHGGKEEKTWIPLKTKKNKKPFGTRSLKNRLNLLTGREWIRFTKSWYIHRPPPRKKEEILHPAKFPESMIRKYITFFTKPSELILDPFLGTGSTLISAKQCNRSGVGVELSPFYTNIAKQRLKELKTLYYPPIYQTRESGYWIVFQGNSKQLKDIWKDHQLPKIDFCITSPPYWSQLERNELRQKTRKDQGLHTKYSDNDPNDLANIKDYTEFLKEQREIFGNVYDLLRLNGYLVIITNNIFANGRIYPLAYDTAISITSDKSHPWVLKDEKLWLQDDKTLLALGVNNAWVGNRCHQYCLIFRKETSK